MVSKLLLRFHFTMIFLSLILFGVFVSRTLIYFGLNSIAFRYPAAVIISYAFFFVMVRLWFNYAADLVKSGKMSPIKSQAIETKVVTQKKSKKAWDWLDVGSIFDLDAALFVLLFFAVCWAGVSLIVDAPIILTEAVFEFALSAGLLNKMRQMDNSSWIGSVAKATFARFLVILIFTIVVSLFLHQKCPNAERLSEIMRGCS